MIKTSLPGYWTPQELAVRIGRSTMYVHYKITGRFNREGKLVAEPVLPALQPHRDLFVEFNVGVRFILDHLESSDREAFLRELQDCSESNCQDEMVPESTLVGVAS